MEPNLSPGPWTVDSECGDESVLDADGFMAADCAIFSPREDFRKRGGDNVANARLIAAAPEMLEALREASGVLSNIPAPHSHPLWVRMIAAIRKAEDAVAKATAQGIEAGTGETREAGLDAEHESPVAEGDAPNPSNLPHIPRGIKP